jgi:hypothetical protein
VIHSHLTPKNIRGHYLLFFLITDRFFRYRSGSIKQNRTWLGARSTVTSTTGLTHPSRPVEKMLTLTRIGSRVARRGRKSRRAVSVATSALKCGIY